jgi:murein DD-endopeptidase MepM/ murein hydrolase activator NlpD
VRVNASIRRIEELKQLCLARLRPCRRSTVRVLAEAFTERQILVRGAGRISVYRLSRGAQLGLAAAAIVTSGWAITVVVGLVLAGPAPRPREGPGVVALTLEPPAPAAATTTASRLRHGNGEGAMVIPVPAAELPADDIPGETSGEAVPVKQVFFPAQPAPRPVLEPAPGPASEPDQPPAALAEPASADPAALTVDADAERTCAHVADKAEPVAVQGADVLERLQAQLAAVSERVFALATRGLGAPAPAEDAGAARNAEEGEAAALAQMASLERHVDRLATGVSALHSAETELLREVQPQLAFFIATAERVIERAGMDLDDVFQERTKPRRSAEGGPFIAAISGPLAAERAALQSDLAYWQALRALVKRMPLAAPLDRYAISSSYGIRRDPLNNRQAMHHGIDLIAAANAPIRAPAPGIVVFAGRNGGYGNMVEIDHGRSLRTRYAHLRTIMVKAGEKVGFQQKLGTLGNSGRSTGAHLHYEILIAGKPADPLNFIKAGQHVFQE